MTINRFLVDVTFGKILALEIGYSARHNAYGIWLYFRKQEDRDCNGNLWSAWHWEVPVLLHLNS